MEKYILWIAILKRKISNLTKSSSKKFYFIFSMIGTQERIGCTISCFSIPKHHIWIKRRNWTVKRKGKYWIKFEISQILIYFLNCMFIRIFNILIFHLKMQVDESTLGKNGKGPRNGKEELKDLREEMVANFKEQMKLR